METPMEISVSLNWSNPFLRWGHTSQPITMSLEIRHPTQSQSSCSALLSFFLLSWILSEILFHEKRPTPRGGSGYHLLASASQSLLFLLKLLSLYLLSLSATVLWVTHSFTKYTIPGGNPSPSKVILLRNMSAFALIRSVSSFWPPVIFCLKRFV